MRILTINCNPDLSYFTDRGLKFNIDHKDIAGLKFSEKFNNKCLNEDGKYYDIYKPDISSWTKKNISGYDIVIIGVDRKDYSSKIKFFGGVTELSIKGMYPICYVNNEQPYYVIHEMHHALCRLLWVRGYSCNDYMDKDSQNRPYFHNQYPLDPTSNYAQTWAEISKHLDVLNSIGVEPTATITRQQSIAKETLGEIIASYNGVTKTWKTLEKPWLNNQKNISCIPIGTYKCKRIFSTKFLKYVYALQNVPNRAGIYIHSGNYYSDIEGCILLGTGIQDINKDNVPDVINSRIAVQGLFDLFTNKDFTLIIK